MKWRAFSIWVCLNVAGLAAAALPQYRIEVLHAPPGFSHADAVDLNNNGDVLGSASYPAGTRPVLWRSSPYPEILGGHRLIGYAPMRLNDHRDVVLAKDGEVLVNERPINDPDELQIWGVTGFNNNREMTFLASDYRWHYYRDEFHQAIDTIEDIQGITDEGIMGGSVWRYEDQANWGYYATGTLTSVNVLGPRGVFTAVATHNYMVGVSFDLSQGQTVCEFDGESLHEVSAFRSISGFEYASTDDVNSEGWFVGEVHSTNTFAYVSDGNAVYNIEDLWASSVTGWTDIDLRSINDWGQILGMGLKDGFYHPFIATPVPEPATLAGIALGAFSLVARRRQRRKISQGRKQ